MSETEKNTFLVDVDPRPGMDGLDKLRKGSDNLGGGLDKVKAGLEKFDVATRETQKLVGGLAGAMGDGKSSGLEFLGVAGDLAGAFLSGGIFAVGMAAGAFVVSKVAEAYIEASTNSRILEMAMPGLSASIVRLKDAALQPGMQAVDDFRKQLRDFGKDTRQIAVDAQQLLLVQLQQRQINLDLSIQRENEELVSLARRKLRGENVSAEDIKQQSDVLELVNQRKAATDQAYQTTIKNLGELKKIDAELDRKEAGKKYQDQLAGGGVKSGADSNEYFRRKYGLTPAEANEQEQKQLDANLQAAGKWADDRLAVDMRYYDAKSKLRELDLQQEQQKQAQLASMYAESIGIVVHATDTFVQEFIAGNDFALAHLVENIMKAAGQAMIGHGINALAGGLAANSLIPGSGVAGVATGLGLIAGGIALGGIAAGIQALSGENKKEAEKTTGVNTTKVSSTTPASHVGGGGRGESGTTVYEFNYGVAGPAPDETARAVARMSRRAGDRGFVDVNVVRGR